MREHPRDASRTVARPDGPILRALGIEDERIAWMRGPTVVDHLHTATPMTHNKSPYSINPALLPLWDRIRSGLLEAEAQPEATAERIFVSRRSGNRLCRNWDEVEALFVEHGFDVVLPAELSVPQQAHVFARARVIAGFGGTGMFNLLFARQRPTVVVLNHRSYDARNEHLITALTGADLHYLWSDAEREQSAGRFSYRAFQSGWTFDWGANGSALRGLLERS